MRVSAMTGTTVSGDILPVDERPVERSFQTQDVQVFVFESEEMRQCGTIA